MKIIVFALSGIGDALMFSPSIRLIKENCSDCKIDLLAMYKAVKEVYDANPFVDKVFYFDFLSEGYLKSFKYLLSLRGDYDLSFNVYPSNRKEYNLISFLVNARTRAAVKYKLMDFQNLGFLNNCRVEENFQTHNVETNATMVAKALNFNVEHIPPLDLFIPKEIEIKAENTFASLNLLKTNLTVGLHPGCSTLKNHINRRWSPDYFAELITMIEKKYDANFLLFGGPDELELRDYIKKKTKSERTHVVKTGSFLETAAVMKKCDVFVTNDSSLMHTAAALRLKILPIIGPTNLNFIKPWRTAFVAATLNLECSPCFFYSPKPLNCRRSDLKYKCVKELTPQIVFKKFEEIISL